MTPLISPPFVLCFPSLTVAHCAAWLCNQWDCPRMARLPRNQRPRADRRPRQSVSVSQTRTATSWLQLEGKHLITTGGVYDYNIKNNVPILICDFQVGMTTDDIDFIVHQETIKHNAYPSPLRYGGFPKSVCTSVNNVICHGIPDR